MKNKVIVVGPFPPPVHGMSKNLKIVADDLGCMAEVIKIDTSPSSLVRGFGYHAKKIKKFINNLIKISSIRNAHSVYMPPDGGFGAWYSLIYLFAMRNKVKKFFLHHRSFNYINKKSLAYVIINKIFEKKIINIFLCDCMESEYKKIYKINCIDSYVVSNAIHVIDNVKNSSREKDTICYLSNISEEKGIVRVIDAYKLLKKNGFNFKLKIGGKFENKKIEEYVMNEVSCDKNIIYDGFVSDKVNFFSDCFAMFFPTAYKNEAQPNVIFEAMSFGVAVFSVDRGCISSDVYDDCGFVLGLNSFADDVLEVFGRYDNPVDDLLIIGANGAAAVSVQARNSVKNNRRMLEDVSGLLAD